MKKTLSILLAVIMTLSVFTVAAFAEDEPDLTGYVAIPKSAEGLEEGDYYLDFSGTSYGDIFYLVDFFFNKEELKLKKSDGEDVSSLITMALARVGTNWVQAKVPGEDKAAGDYYVDLAESTWSIYVDAIGIKGVYVNTAESDLFKVKIVYTDDEGVERKAVEPLYDRALNATSANAYTDIAESVKLYEGGQDNPGTDDNTDNGSSGNFFSNLWANIVAFFQKIGDFFRNLFKK